MRRSLCFASLLCTLSFASAQTQNIAWHPSQTIPTSRNAFPWGSDGIRYQTIVDGSKLGSRPQIIQDIFIAGDSRNGDLEINYDDIEIRMGATPQLSPTNNWTTNNPNPKTVYRGPLRVRFKVGKWLGIGLPTPYLWLPTGNNKHYCFEVIVWNARGYTNTNFYYPAADSGTRRAFRFRWTTNQTQTPLTGGSANAMGILLGNGNFVTVGTGCKSSASTTLEIGASTFPQSGKPIDVTLTGAAGPRPAALMIGGSFTQFGAINLPFDLKPLGADGCFVWNDILVILPAVTTPSGTAKVPLVVPPSAGNGRVYLHFWVADAQANSFGWTTSSLGKMLLGN